MTPFGIIDLIEWVCLYITNWIRQFRLPFYTVRVSILLSPFHKNKNRKQKEANMFEKIQAWEISLVERLFERFSRWTQKWVGLDCFFWAMCTVIIEIIVLTAMFVEYIKDKDFISTFLTIFTILTILRNIGYMTVNIPTDRANCYTDISQLRKNRLLIKGSALRSKVFLIQALIPILCLRPIAIGKIELIFVLIVLLLASEYILLAFTACTPLPPKQSKLKQGATWLSKLIQKGVTSGGLPVPT